MSVGVIGICLPTLQPIVSYVIPARFRFRSRGSSSETRRTTSSSIRRWPYSSKRFLSTTDEEITLDGFTTRDGDSIIPSLTAVKVGGRSEIELADEMMQHGIQVQHEVDVRSESH